MLDSGSVLGKKWNNFLGIIQNELNSISGIQSDIMGDMQTDTGSSDAFQDPDAIENFSDFHIDDSNPQQNNSSVAVDSELYSSLAEQAQKRGVSVETLTNLWLQQKVDEYTLNQ